MAEEAASSGSSVAAAGGGEVSVLLVDQHAVTRVGIRTILAAEPRVRVVGECGCAADAVRLAAALHPRVAVVDLLDGDCSGFGLIKDLRIESRETRTLVCSGPLASATIGHLFAIGALGYVRKDEPPEQLLAAVRSVAAGKGYVDPDSAGDVIADIAGPRRNGSSRHAPAAGEDVAGGDVGVGDVGGGDVTGGAGRLSGCELEVLHMIGHGRSTRAIASILFKSVKTIETYRCRIRAKLGLDGPTALAQTAWRFVHRVGMRVGSAR